MSSPAKSKSPGSKKPKKEEKAMGADIRRFFTTTKPAGAEGGAAEGGETFLSDLCCLNTPSQQGSTI